MQEALNTETENRTKADEVLQGNIDSVNDKVDDLTVIVDEVKVDIETKYTELNTKISKQLLVSEGSGFDTEKGILTLKSKSGENDIQIQFSFNFGDI